MRELHPHIAPATIAATAIMRMSTPSGTFPPSVIMHAAVASPPMSTCPSRADVPKAHTECGCYGKRNAEQHCDILQQLPYAPVRSEGGFDHRSVNADGVLARQRERYDARDKECRYDRADADEPCVPPCYGGTLDYVKEGLVSLGFLVAAMLLSLLFFLLVCLCHEIAYLFLDGGPAVDSSGYAAGVYDHYTVAEPDKHIEVLSDKYDGNAAFLLLIEQVIYHVGGIDVESADGICRHKYRRSRRDLASDKHLLYVAAGETADGGKGTRGNDLEILDYLVGEVVRLLSVQKDGAPLAVAAQHHVVDYVHVSDKSHAETVLGHERQTDTEVAYLYGSLVAEIYVLSVLRTEICDLARIYRLQSRDSLKQLALSRACDACDTEYLACARLERNAVQNLNAVAVGIIDITNEQSQTYVARLAAVDVQSDLFADHHLGKTCLIGLCGLNGSNMLALAENGDAVGDGKHLVQLVCNNNNRFALVAHTTENVKQLFRLLRGKHGGGLIKNKYVRTAVEYLQYLYRLLFGNAHIVDLLVGIHYKAVFLCKRDYLLARREANICPHLCRG